MHSKRFSKVLLAGAATAGLSAATANAAMVMGLRAIGTYSDTTLSSFSPLSGGDTPTSVSASVGKVVSMIVYADVTQTGDSPATGYPVFSSAGGRIVSSGGGVRMDAIGNFPDNSTSGSGSSPGVFKDIDGDGDLDNGNTDANSADPTGWVLYRGNTSSSELGPGATSPSGGNLYGNKPDGSSGAPVALGTTGFEYYLGEVDFLITGATGNATNVVWQFRPQQGNATWFENATKGGTANKSATVVSYSGGSLGSTFSSGAAVVVGSGGGITPEPAALGLAGLAGLGMLSRRNKKA